MVTAALPSTAAQTVDPSPATSDISTDRKDLIWQKIQERRSSQVRQRLLSRLVQTGGLDKAFDEMDLDGSRTIEIDEFTSWCDRQGLAELYKGQGEKLREEIGNRQLGLQELRAFLEKAVQVRRRPPGGRHRSASI